MLAISARQRTTACSATIHAAATATGKPLIEGAAAPWDITAITVREEPGVLGIFDHATRGSARTVTSTVRHGMAQLDRALPFSWDDHVVVYSDILRQQNATCCYAKADKFWVRDADGIPWEMYTLLEDVEAEIATRLFLSRKTVERGTRVFRSSGEEIKV